MNKNYCWTAAKLTIGIFLVISVCIWTYRDSIENELVWDSYHYLVKHVFYISSLNLDNVIWMFLSLDPYWHPLTWLSWAIDYQMYGGLVSRGYHLSNNILHAINSGIVFILMLVAFGLKNRVADRFPIRTDNKAILAATFAALLFAVHPQHVEAVVWVAQRKDLLCQLFLMTAMLSYVKFTTSRGHSKTYWLNGTLGLFALALLSKPMAVTFPVLLLLIDVYPLRRTRLFTNANESNDLCATYVLLREKVPFFLLSLLVILITLHVQNTWVSGYSLDLRLLNAFNSILLYIGKFVLPLNFAPLYPYSVDLNGVITWKAFLPIFGFLGITIAVLWLWKRNIYSGLIAWLFYLIALSPVLGLIQAGEQGAADRFAYLPTLPAYLLIGAGILVGLEKAGLKNRVLMFLFLSVLVFALSAKTKQQIHVWKNPQSLWSYIVKLNPTNVTAQYNLGIIYFRQEDFEQAALHFDRSVELPSNPISSFLKYPSLAYRGLSYLYLGRYKEALKDYSDLVGVLDNSNDRRLDRNCIYFNGGWIYASFGELEKANELFSKIESDSSLKDDYIVWLEKLDLANDVTFAIEALPNFCSSVFGSEAAITENARGPTKK